VAAMGTRVDGLLNGVGTVALQFAP
jgi:hypothetical protein